MAPTWQNLVDALFKERHTTRIEVTIPSEVYYALRAYIFTRNHDLPEDQRPMDVDYVVGTVLARFLAKQLTPREVTVIPPAIPDDTYTQGRKQARALPTYSEFPPS